MTDEAWRARIAAEWAGIMQRAQAKVRRERQAARIARFRRALDYIRTQGEGV